MTTEDELITAAIDYAKSAAPDWQNARHWRVGFARAACRSLLAKLDDEVEALRREQPEWASYELSSVRMYNRAVDDVLALLAVVENDQ